MWRHQGIDDLQLPQSARENCVLAASVSCNRARFAIRIARHHIRFCCTQTKKQQQKSIPYNINGV